VVIRFDSEDASARLGSQPEQDRWPADALGLFEAEPIVLNSSEVIADLHGNPDRARFVQFIQGRVNDPERARDLWSQYVDLRRKLRPDVLASLAISHGGGAYTLIIYYSSEAEAREGERKPLPPEWRTLIAEMLKNNIGKPAVLDAQELHIVSPAVGEGDSWQTLGDTSLGQAQAEDSDRPRSLAR
jgi:hypothetical protein